MREGWRVKAMHRLIMTSNTYRQSSAVTARCEQLDPSNHFLSRMPMRRMDAEELRDTLLALGGQLDETRFGPAEPVTIRADGLVLSGKRRSIYVQQLRKQSPSLLESFDLPAMNPNCLQRTDSLVAPQALHLLNDSSIREMARQFATRVRRVAGDNPMRQVEHIYWVALSRPPSVEEMKICLESLASFARQSTADVALAGESKAESSPDALATLCHTVMNSAAFLYLD